MVNAIEAVGLNAPAQTAAAVSATDGKSGETKEVAAVKPSIVVTHGEKNRAAEAVKYAQEQQKEKRPGDTVSVNDFFPRNEVADFA